MAASYKSAWYLRQFGQARKAVSAATHGNDTSHNDWDDTLHHEIRSENTHGRDADLRFNRSAKSRGFNTRSLHRTWTFHSCRAESSSQNLAKQRRYYRL